MDQASQKLEGMGAEVPVYRTEAQDEDPGREAKDLARAFVRLVRAVPVRGALLQKPREALVQKLEATKDLTKSTQECLDWCRDDSKDLSTLEDRMAAEFSKDPSLPGRLWAAEDWPRPWWLVLREELKQITYRRQENLEKNLHDAECTASVYGSVKEKKLVGLCLSGGGIRSATFNLGVLQALAEFGLLKHIDLLSTVSGGGYIGAWFASWLKRSKLPPAQFEKELAPRNTSRNESAEQKP